MWSRNCLPFRGSWVHPSICWVWAARSLIFYVMCCTSLVGFGYCVVCPSIYGLWLPCWILCCLSFDLRPLITLLDIVLSVLRFTASDYPVGYCVVCPSIYGLWLPSSDLRPLITGLWLSASDLRPLITGLWFTVSDLRSLITGLWFTASDYRPLIYGLWLPATDLRPLITQLVSSNLSYHFIVLFMARYHRNVTDRGMQFNIIT
jgi:hypothetical protein